MEGSQRKRYKHSNSEETDASTADVRPAVGCGTLAKVALKNFMCHDHLEIDFHPQVNLLQGRNGSGKSAILTAVILGLGGTTRTTNRGKNVKELIKYNKHTATIQIVLTNCGKEAYKGDVYGDAIIVERRISSSGMSAFNIKSKSGSLVSSKKEDLQKIVEYFNLNVENPLTVLNQDMSRSFLSSTDPKSLYKFFLEVTQLKMISDNYKQLLEYLDTTRNRLETCKECLPDLERELNKIQGRYEFCQKQKEKRKNLISLRRELAWATIIQHEKTSDAIGKEFADCQRVVAKIERALQGQNGKLESIQNEHSELREQYAKLSKDMEKQSVVVKAKKAEFDKSKENVKTGRRLEEKLNRQVQTYKNEVSIMKNAVKMDHSEAQRKWEAQHAKHLEMRQSFKSQIEEANQIIKTEETHIFNIQNTVRVKEDALQQLKFEDMNKTRNIRDLQTELKTLQSKQTNAFTVFGRWVQPLLDKIEVAFQQNLFKKKPIGPLGAYIEVLDSGWAHIAEQVIGVNISAFCVDNQDDAQVLDSLFESTKPSKIISRFRPRHDARLIAEHSVMSSTYKSLWSILKISNDVVANILIDRYQLETTLLIPTADEAGAILKDRNTVPQNCKLAYTLRGDRYFPDPNYRVYSGHGSTQTRFLQTSVADKARAVESDISRLKYESDRVAAELKTLSGECAELRRQEKDSNQKLNGKKVKVRSLRQKLTELEGQEEPPPPSLSLLEEDIKKQEAYLADATDALSKTKEQIQVTTAEFTVANGAYSEAMRSIEQTKEEANDIMEKIKNLIAKEKEMKRTESLLKQQMKKQVEKTNETEKRHTEMQEKLQKETEAANNLLPRIDTDRSTEDIHKEYKHLEAHLNREQEQQGDPVEIMEKSRYENLAAVLTKINNCLQEREEKGRRFRKVLSIWIKASFKEALNIRNLDGKATFDFEKETLTLLAQKRRAGTASDPMRLSSQSKRDQQQSVSMMSGGERSFATVAFILALWEVIHSPVRILDEFDVFMDIVSRRQSLDMMLTGAKPNVQYLFLTPLEINRSDYSVNLNVLRMPDPERKSST